MNDHDKRIIIDLLNKDSIRKELNLICTSSLDESTLYLDNILKEVRRADLYPGQFTDILLEVQPDILNCIEAIPESMFTFSALKGKLHIPSNIQGIDKNAFNNCDLDELEIENGLKYIQENAFYYSGLIKINIPASLTAIGNAAFYYSTELEEIDFSLADKMNFISNSSFYNCYSLNHVKSPPNCKVISMAAFYGCYNLKKVELNEGITRINMTAFGECKGLEEIYMPESITQLEKHVFYNCSPTILTKNNYVINYCKENDLNYEIIK